MKLSALRGKKNIQFDVSFTPSLFHGSTSHLFQMFSSHCEEEIRLGIIPLLSEKVNVSVSKQLSWGEFENQLQFLPCPFDDEMKNKDEEITLNESMKLSKLRYLWSMELRGCLMALSLLRIKNIQI